MIQKNSTVETPRNEQGRNSMTDTEHTGRVTRPTMSADVFKQPPLEHVYIGGVQKKGSYLKDAHLKPPF